MCTRCSVLALSLHSTSLTPLLTHSCTLLLCRAADIHGAHDELTRVLGGAGIINTTVATHSGVCEWVAQPEGGTTLIQMGDVVDRYVLTLSLTHSLTHALIHSCTHSLTPLLISHYTFPHTLLVTINDVYNVIVMCVCVFVCIIMLWSRSLLHSLTHSLTCAGDPEQRRHGSVSKCCSALLQKDLKSSVSLVTMVRLYSLLLNTVTTTVV